jgi:hypothetical protein
MAPRKKPPEAAITTDAVAPADAAPTLAPFDLSGLGAFTESQERGIPLPIIIGGRLLITIQVCGPDSERVRDARNWAYAEVRRLNEAALLRELSPEDSGRIAIGELARCIAGWQFAEGITLDGEAPAFSVPTAEKLLARVPTIRHQVENVVNSRDAFFAASRMSW